VSFPLGVSEGDTLGPISSQRGYNVVPLININHEEIIYTSTAVQIDGFSLVVTSTHDVFHRSYTIKMVSYACTL